MNRTWLRGILACVAMGPFLLQPAGAQAPFYEGKTITIVIGATGGSLNVSARIVARHLGKYVPGNPAVIVQNMTGAAHLVATNNVYNVAKPDGLLVVETGARSEPTLPLPQRTSRRYGSARLTLFEHP